MIKNQLLDKFQNGRLIMKKDIYSNIKDSDALESFFECITSCSINSDGVRLHNSMLCKTFRAKQYRLPFKIFISKAY